MDPTEERIASHYATDRLLERIEAGLAALGHDPQNISQEALKPVDEFHSAGFASTRHLLDRLYGTPVETALDIGSGIGGPARSMAARLGCRVEGVDLTPDFVETARELSRRTGMDGVTSFCEGSATALPQADTSVDLAWMLHVGMNVADKRAIFAEAARVLRPMGHFVVFDLVLGDDPAPPDFPVPWASAPGQSHLAAAQDYRAAAAEAGFAQLSEADRGAFVLETHRDALAEIDRNGPPPLGLHLVLGADAREKIGNFVAALEAGRITPVEMVFRKERQGVRPSAPPAAGAA